MNGEILYGTGRIGEIISSLKERHGVDSVKLLDTNQKLNGLRETLQFESSQFDDLIADNSPVLRPVKAHAFESVFDLLLRHNGYEVTEVGGDVEVDRIVNNITLQLKTPTLSGTRGTSVQYKTHKTHGAKSEQESLEYYHQKSHFADYLVGLITYSPLRIIFLHRDDLPSHRLDDDRIISPFNVDWASHRGLNAFNVLGADGIDLSVSQFMPVEGDELLPRSAIACQVNSEIIIDTILTESNFRIWDMSIRGFARQDAFKYFLSGHNVKQFSSERIRPVRGDKADLALRNRNTRRYEFLQVKGVSINNCRFIGTNSVVAVETQLTRGRVNDHPTQSRLYLATDFDYLLLIIDPPLTQVYKNQMGQDPNLDWEFYAIPTNELERHHIIQRRLKSLQNFLYRDLEPYRIDEQWLDQWEVE